AGWAGPEKGYTIQIESDVEGDGQSDLATRYMRLQQPINGEFAPDIKEYYPDTTPIANPTTSNPESTDTITPPPFALEAENMRIDQESQAQVSHEPQASAGASMHFTGNTTIRQNVERKADQLMIRARANTCSVPFTNVSMGPAIAVVSVNNEEVGRIEVISNIYQTYAINVEGLDG